MGAHEAIAALEEEEKEKQARKEKKQKENRAIKVVSEIEKRLGFPDDDMGQYNGSDVLYGSELELNLTREGFQIRIKAVDSERLRQALTYLRALFPEETAK